MTPPVQPEVTDQNLTQDPPNLETPTPTPPITPPVTQQPAAPSIDSNALRTELAALQQTIVREQADTIVNLQRQLAEKNATPSAPADDAARFLEAPRQMIREELQSVVAPLLEFMGGIKKNDAYSNLKNECKQHATLGPLLTQVEADVDRLMATSDPTPQNLQTAIFTAIGLKTAGLATAPVATPTPPPTPPSPPVSTTPPYIPPSPPAPPTGGSKNPADAIKAKVAAMTETEREVARRWGISPEQYVANRDASEDANSWKGGTNV